MPPAVVPSRGGVGLDTVARFRDGETEASQMKTSVLLSDVAGCIRISTPRFRSAPSDVTSVPRTRDGSPTAPVDLDGVLASLSGGGSAESVARAVADGLARALRAELVEVWSDGEAGLELSARCDASDGAGIGPLDVTRLFAEVLADGRPLHLEGSDARLAEVGAGVRAAMVLPLSLEARVAGALVVAFALPRTFAPALRERLVTFAGICALALDRQRVVAHERRLAARLEGLQAITGALSRAMRDVDVARVVTSIGCATVGAASAILQVVEDEGGVPALHLLGASEVDEEHRRAWSRQPLDASSPTGEAARTRAPVVIRTERERAARYPAAVGHPLGPAGARLALPLMVGDRLLGAFAFTFDGDRSFEEGELSFVESLAEQAALALERAQLFERERRSRRRAEEAASRSRILAALGKELSCVGDPIQIGGAALRAASDVAGAVSSAVWRLDRPGERLELLTSEGFSEEAKAGYATISLSLDSPLVYVVGSAEPIWLDHPGAYEREYPGSARRARQATVEGGGVACVPLVTESIVVGAMALVLPPGRSVSAQERSFLISVGALCAQAMERDCLQREDAASRSRLRDLQELTAALSKTTRTIDIADVVVEVGTGVLDASAAAVWLWSEDTDGFTAAAWRGLPADYDTHWGVVRESDPLPLGQVARTGEPLFVESERDHGVLDADVIEYWVRGVGVSAFAIVPIRVAGRVTAVAAFAFRSERYFSETDCAFILNLARQAEQALERARLYDGEAVARREAEVANRAKDEFLAMLGHELRNPLAPIVTALQLMELRANGQLAHEREVIQRQVHHLMRLVDDLLDVSRITRGKLELQRERVELGAIVHRAVEMASPLIRAAGAHAGGAGHRRAGLRHR